MPRSSTDSVTLQRNGLSAAPSGDAASRAAVYAVAAGAVAAGCLISLAGTRLVWPEVSPWPRFWATAYFIILLWPAGLWLLGTLAGWRAEAAAAAVLLGLTVAQQAGAGSLLLPQMVRWSVSLSAPGEAIRQRILLPGENDPLWQRAWQEAARAGVAICTVAPLEPAAGVFVQIGGRPPAELAAAPRLGPPGETGWYVLPVTREELRGLSSLEVVVERTAAPGAPARICGGREDPARPGAGGAARRLNGRWQTALLADVPFPLLDGRPAPGRYFIELRFYDASDRPVVGVWY